MVRERSCVVTMKSIDMYILHDSSLVVPFSNISAYFACIAEPLIIDVHVEIDKNKNGLFETWYTCNHVEFTLFSLLS